MNVVDFIYASYGEARPYFLSGTDDCTRYPEFATQLLHHFGFIEHPIRTILVTGSKGKGSVSRMIAFLLEKGGYRVGHYSSPHLLDFSERIRVNGKAIADADLERLATEIAPIVEALDINPIAGEYISPIAISQLLALLYFREQHVDVAIIEAGRGGRFDDTNRIPHEVAVITPILEEHLEQLGPRLREVVWHKLGILTPEVQKAYISKQGIEVASLVAKQLRSEAHSIPIYFDGRDFGATDIQLSGEGTTTTVHSHGIRGDAVTLPLLGSFQADNYALAYTVANDWCDRALAHIAWGQHLPTLRWPGRCEIIAHYPTVLLDGGIHRTSAEQVRDLIMALSHSRLHVVLSIPTDKDIRGVIAVWAPLADRLITTTTSNAHLRYDADYQALLDEQYVGGRHIADVATAIHFAQEGLGANDLLLLMGTQSFVGDVKRLWGESVRDL